MDRKVAFDVPANAFDLPGTPANAAASIHVLLS
jgi:hypothetical protein